MSKTNQYEVFRLACAHPDWTCNQIAEHIGCTAGYVRRTNQRQKMGIPNMLQTEGNKP